MDADEKVLLFFVAVYAQIIHRHSQIISHHSLKIRTFLSRSEKLFLPDFFFGEKQKSIAEIFPKFFFKLLLFLFLHEEIHSPRLQTQAPFQALRYFRVILDGHATGVHMAMIGRHDHQRI